MSKELEFNKWLNCAEDHYCAGSRKVFDTDTSTKGFKELAWAMFAYLTSIVEDSVEFKDDERQADILEIERECAKRSVDLEHILCIVKKRLDRPVPRNSERIMYTATDLYNKVRENADMEIDYAMAVAMKTAALNADTLRSLIRCKYSPMTGTGNV